MIQRTAWGGLAGGDVPAREAGVVVMGVPWDGSACWRRGAAQAPGRLREISVTSPAISEIGMVVDPTACRLVDLGDVEPDPAPTAEPEVSAYFASVESRWRAALAPEGGRRPFGLAIGGDHSVSIPLIRAFAAVEESPFGLVLLDAHPDLFDVYEGSRLSNACPMRRALETGRLSPEHLVIVGTRSYNAAELELMRDRGIRFVPAREVDRRGVDDVVAEVGARLADVTRVYLTVDIDVADPSCAPGTGAPVAGGLSSRQLLDLLRRLHDRVPVRAMDLVEISPPLDPTDATLFLGLQIAFETLCSVSPTAPRRDGAVVD